MWTNWNRLHLHMWIVNHHGNFQKILKTLLMFFLLTQCPKSILIWILKVCKFETKLICGFRIAAYDIFQKNLEKSSPSFVPLITVSMKTKFRSKKCKISTKWWTRGGKETQIIHYRPRSPPVLCQARLQSYSELARGAICRRVRESWLLEFWKLLDRACKMQNCHANLKISFC